MNSYLRCKVTALGVKLFPAALLRPALLGSSENSHWNFHTKTHKKRTLRNT
ncbi:MAG: hypothetical protein K0T53_04195 [Wolbachia pipientis]|nr:hypothetical protein [Wolbachia pipientis]